MSLLEHVRVSTEPQLSGAGRWRPRWEGRWSGITVDLDTKCIKLADPSQTIWLIHSHSGPSEQGVEGRDQWHNRLCQTAAQKRPDHLWWQSWCHQSHYKPPFSPETNIALLWKKRGKSQLSGRSPPFFLFVSEAFGSRRTGHRIPLQPFAEAMSRKTNMLFLIKIINVDPLLWGSRGNISALVILFWKWQNKTVPCFFFYPLFSPGFNSLCYWQAESQ